jgi:hypothetical protein
MPNSPKPTDARSLAASLQHVSHCNPRPRPLSAAREALRRDSIETVFLSDATGSMEPYLDAVKAHFSALMPALAARHPAIRFAAGFYRDEMSPQPFNFLRKFSGLDGWEYVQEFLDKHGYSDCTGNRTWDEALGAALYHVANFPWTAKTRIVVHVGDRASHGYSPLNAAYHSAVDTSLDACALRLTHANIVSHLRRAGLCVYMVLCGDNPAAREQYQRIAEATGGRFVAFSSLSSPNDLPVIIQAAVAHATGRDVPGVIADSQAKGHLGNTSAAALLGYFKQD